MVHSDLTTSEIGERYHDEDPLLLKKSNFSPLPLEYTIKKLGWYDKYSVRRYYLQVTIKNNSTRPIDHTEINQKIINHSLLKEKPKTQTIEEARRPGLWENFTNKFKKKKPGKIKGFPIPPGGTVTFVTPLYVASYVITHDQEKVTFYLVDKNGLEIKGTRVDISFLADDKKLTKQQIKYYGRQFLDWFSLFFFWTLVLVLPPWSW